MSDDELAPLRRATPPLDERFADRLMRRLATRPLPAPSRAVRAWRWVTAPVTLRVRPATVLTAAAVVALVVLRPRAPQPTAAPPVEARRDDTPAQVWVRFALPARAARAVSLAGDFNGWRSDATPLERGADGVWRVTLPLGAGRWSYSFVVDGVWVEDPAAEAYREDGFGGRNAIIRVGG